MFKKITPAPADPILGLADAFNDDTRGNKINLGIGVYKNANGQTTIMQAVKEAEKKLLTTETDKNYLPIDGIACYQAFTQALIFGEGSPIIQQKRAKTSQTLGGTGALRVAAEFVKHQVKAKKIWVSTPTWPNHLTIFQATGLEIGEYRYYDSQNHQLDWDNMLADLNQAQAGDVVLFHACCHNPTGIDPTPEQWQILADLSAQKGWLPLFDFAYQGFGNGLEEDAYSIRTFLKNHKELLIANSYSKNFGLYNERTGAFTLVAENAEIAEICQTQIKYIIRTLYSNPAKHGAGVVNTILGDDILKKQWEIELTEMRDRIKQMRALFVTLLAEYGAKENFDFILHQNGMFSFSGLSPEQVDRLKQDFAIYMTRSGRINVAGITQDNIHQLCKSIVSVL